MCAILNQRGGHVLFGVTPTGDLVGQQVSERTIEEVSAEIQRINPTAFPEIERVRVPDNLDVIAVRGVRKVWKQLNREGHRVARCKVERMMRGLGLRRAARGRRLKTTIPGAQRERTENRVHRAFTVSRPNPLLVNNLSYVSTWRGLVYAALVIDAFAWRIVGWRVSSSLPSD